MRLTFLVRALFLCACSFVAIAVAHAQDPDPTLEQGIKPFGAYNGGNIDSVSMVNGGLTVQFPLFSYPQRGARLTLNLQLTYTAGPGWTGSCQYVQFNAYCTVSGKPGNTSIGESQQLNVNWTEGGDASLGAWPYLTDATGASHPLGLTGQSPGNPPNYTFESVDATGMKLAGFEFGSQIGTSPPPTKFNPGTVTDRNGVQYVETCTNQWLAGACPTGYTKTDSNGNQITMAFPTGWTDTLGRTIATPPGGPNGQNPGVSTDSIGCQGLLPTSNSYLWTIPAPNGSAKLKVCFAKAITKTRFYPNATTESGGGGFYFIQTLIVYNGSSWTTSPAWVFQYDDRDPGDPSSVNYGSLTQITLPTGGTISYTYSTLSLVPNSFRRSVAKRIVNANDGTGLHTWTYNYALANPILTSTTTDPLGNDTVYTITGFGTWPKLFYFPTRVDSYQGSHSAGSLLKSVVTTYSYLQRTNPQYINVPSIVNVVPTQATMIFGNGQQTKATSAYDSGFTFLDHDTGGTQYTATYGNLISRNEYDFGSGAPGSLLRTTTTSYLAFSDSTYLTANLLALPSSIQVTDGGGTQRALTNYSYDEGESGIHGNLTSTHRWLNATGGYLVTNNVYNSHGLVTSTTDPRNNPPTTYGYSSGYAGSGPTSVMNALNQTTNYTYDLNSGLLTSTLDPNGQTTSFTYDGVWRLATVGDPDTGSETITYQETSFPFSAIVTKKMTSSQNMITKYLFDGLGRLSETQLTSDPQGVDYTDTTYDADGRVYTVSNPHRSGDIVYLKTFTYDALNRITQVKNQDNTAVQKTYLGRATEVTDEGNGTRTVQRISQTDALGRLTSTCEVSNATLLGIAGTPGACGQDIAGTGFLTNYSHDALGNLLSVTQGGLTGRSFVYDSLSRLTSATNPESGTISYTYDANGNLATKTAPAPNQAGTATVTTTYSYDTLNRLTQKSYSDTVPTYANGTPTVDYGYDLSNVSISGQNLSISNSIGRLSWSGPIDQNGVPITMNVFSYDPLGRTKQIWQRRTAGSGNITVSYVYDLLGDEIDRNLNSQDWASVYNGAGRLTSFTSTNYNNAQNPSNLLSNAAYDPTGRVTSATFANGLSQSWAYNSRGFLAAMAVGTNCSAGSCASSVYSLSTGFAPNGNVLTANDSVNGNWTYLYDDFNRLASGTPSGQPTFTHLYDRYGNRWGQYLNGACTAGLTFCLTFDAKNRVSGGILTYDTAGNVTADSLHHYAYDAENRIKSVDTGAITYIYDAQGRRVVKNRNGSPTDFLYGRDGHIILANSATAFATELYVAGLHLGTYAPSGNGSAFYYDHSDWLGTERVRTDVLGNPCEKIASMPFGDGQAITGTCGDVSTMHFTGKERDTESGLDNFGARYSSSQFGHFMSPDPSNIGANRQNPQTWNAYIYSLNNPLNLIDPTGLYVCEDDVNCGSANDQAFAKSLADAQTAANQLTGDDKADAQRAIDAYGAQGVDNGVNIRFDASIKGGATEVSGVANGEKSADNPTGQNINVTFNPTAVRGDYSAGLVAHEGSHVADGSAWVASGFSPNLNPTNFATEFKAYHVEFNIVNTQLNMKAGPHGTYSGFINIGEHGQVKWKKGDTFKVLTPDLQQKINENYENLNSPAFTRGGVLEP